MAYSKSKKTHKMPDGKVMSGATHSKKSKPVKKSVGKGSSAMKARMAKLRAMKKKK
jgi:hypothetical protein